LGWLDATFQYFRGTPGARDQKTSGLVRAADSTCRQPISGRMFEMKAKLIITPKKAVLDPQGKTVQSALEHIGHTGIKAVHVGKYLEIELEGTDREAARKALDAAAHKFLSNPVIEDYRLEIE
jgi:phosphoribosylformylglycinamidine synthase subunit PurS